MKTLLLVVVMSLVAFTADAHVFTKGAAYTNPQRWEEAGISGIIALVQTTEEGPYLLRAVCRGPSRDVVIYDVNTGKPMGIMGVDQYVEERMPGISLDLFIVANDFWFSVCKNQDFKGLQKNGD